MHIRRPGVHYRGIRKFWNDATGGRTGEQNRRRKISSSIETCRRMTSKRVNILAPIRDFLSVERARPSMSSKRTHSMILYDESREVKKPGRYMASRNTDDQPETPSNARLRRPQKAETMVQRLRVTSRHFGQQPEYMVRHARMLFAALSS